MSSGTARSGPTAPARTSDALWHRLYFFPLPHQQSSLARSTPTPPNISELTATCDRELRDVRAWGAWRRSPAPLDPLLQVGTLGADGRVEAVAGEHEQVGREGEEAAVDGLDDLV